MAPRLGRVRRPRAHAIDKADEIAYGTSLGAARYLRTDYPVHDQNPCLPMLYERRDL